MRRFLFSHEKKKRHNEMNKKQKTLLYRILVAAVLFAYFVNSRFVFRSDASGFSGRFSEFVRFVAGRAFSMALEIGGGELLVGVLRLNESVAKVAVLPVFVLTVNYFVSRFFVFGKKAENGSSRP